MKNRLSQRVVVLSLLLLASVASASEDRPNAANRLLGFIPWVGNNPCEARYRQLAVSPPLKSTAHGEAGFPWRALFGYCVAQSGRLNLHQDWVISYQEGEPYEDIPGDTSIGLGTDFSFQWRHRAGDVWTPYYEGGAGIQYSAATSFPVEGSHWMFTLNAGAGILFPLKSGRELNTAIRYLHISNAGWLGENAGYDAFHLFIGLRW
jgi:hypothetical protein